MMRRFSCLILLVLVQGVSAQVVKMDMFAYGIALQVDGGGAIYSLPLPVDVYRHTVRTDLGDLRVFNRNGEVVPHLLQQPPRTRTEEQRRIVAKLYPLPARDMRPSDGQLHLSINQDGTLIDYYGGPIAQAGGTAGEYYLLDARAAHAPVDSLYLEWDGENNPLLTQVSVFGSDDLNHWQPVVDKQIIASLHYQGFRLKQHSLALPATRKKYYRIHWPPGAQGIGLRKVELSLHSAQRQLEGITLKALPEGDTGDTGDEGRYQFRLNGHLPISRMRLQMPQRNTVVQAKLYSRTDATAPWQLRYQGLFYDLEQQGQRLRSAPVELAPLSHRLWRLEVQPGGGGLGRGEPQLELEWFPHRLLFVARGAGPFTLAYGSQALGMERMPIDPLLQQIHTSDGQSGLIKPALAGKPFVLGGESMLRAPPPQLPWKKWLLWSVLLGGVAVLVLMARALYLQMNSQRS